MSTRKLSILLLLAVLAISCSAQDEQEVPTSCTHDTIDHPDPEPMDIEEDFSPNDDNDHSGRTLASYNNMRIYPVYNLATASSANRNYFQNELIPPILSYYSAALKVKYPVSGLWKTSASSVCGHSTPSALKSGVAADFVYFVTTDASSSYVANTYTCNLASGSSRPIAGQTTISTVFMQATSDVLAHERSMICIIHEMTHALGFSTSMYPHFISSTGARLTGHITSATLDGATSTVINVAPLTTRLRDYYGCSTLKGAYMENSGSSATSGSHFERKIFTFEMMTSGLVNQQQISPFTLALLEGSGWYVPDYTYADGFWFGQGQGCTFTTGSCSSAASHFPTEYCSGSGRMCTNPGRGGGACSSDTRADGCKWVIASESYDCDNTGAESYARLPSLQTFGRGSGARCFSGTLTSSKSAGSSSTYCFKHTCSGSGSNTELTINMNGKNVVCTSEGPKTVSGYAGTINCPDPLTWCSTVGQKLCPRNCMGRGTCVNGSCVCETGAKGADCALMA